MPPDVVPLLMLSYDYWVGTSLIIFWTVSNEFCNMGLMVASPHILVAQEASGHELIRSALLGLNLLTVTDTRDAVQHIEESDIDLFVIGIHFDESRAIELIDTIRTNRKHADSPIVVIRLLPTPFVESLRSAAAVLIKTGSIDAYVELEGKGNAAELLRDAVDEQLSIMNRQRSAA